MPATPARIGFITEAFRSSIASDTAIRTRYGSAARDTLDTPIETYFESSADVQSVANERFALISAGRRRLQVDLARLINFTGSLAFTQVAPAALLIDDEKSLSATVMITGIDAKDYQNERTTLNLWG